MESNKLYDFQLNYWSIRIASGSGICINWGAIQIASFTIFVFLSVRPDSLYNFIPTIVLQAFSDWLSIVNWL